MNTIRYVLSVAWKETQLISRDRGALGVLFLLPLLMGTLIAGPNLMYARRGAQAAISLDVALVNADSGQFGTEVAKAIQSITQLKVETLPSATDAEAMVAHGQATAAILIPADFSQKIDAYTPTVVDVILDPAEPESSSIVAGIMNQVVSEVTIWGEVQYGVRSMLDQSGLLSTATAERRRAIEAQNLGVIMTRLNEMRRDPVIAVVSEDLAGVKSGDWLPKYLAYVFPGFTVYFIFFIVGMAAASLLSERESGVLRRLVAAPIPAGAVIAGKMLAYMALACLQVIVLLSVAHIAFEVPLGLHPLALVPLSVTVAFTATSLGMLVAALSKTSKQADSLGMVMGFVLGAIGGAIPLGPGSMLFRQAGLMGLLARLTPQAHGVEAFYRVMAEDGTLGQILPQIGILLAMGLAFFLIARWRFRFEQ